MVVAGRELLVVAKAGAADDVAVAIAVAVVMAVGGTTVGKTVEATAATGLTVWLLAAVETAAETPNCKVATDVTTGVVVVAPPPVKPLAGAAEIGNLNVDVPPKIPVDVAGAAAAVVGSGTAAAVVGVDVEFGGNEKLKEVAFGSMDAGVLPKTDLTDGGTLAFSLLVVIATEFSLSKMF